MRLHVQIIIPIYKKLGLHCPERGECLIEVKRKDRFIILKVIFIIIGKL